MSHGHSLLWFAAILLACPAIAGLATGQAQSPVTMNHNDMPGVLIWTFAYNLPVNLLWFAAALYAACRTFGDRAGAITKDRMRFFTSIAAAIVIVTSLGAMIDTALLVQNYELNYVLSFDAISWTAAAALIFVSIYFSTVLFLNLRGWASFVPATVMTALNGAWWILGRSTDAPLDEWTVAASLVLAPAVLYSLWRWHAAGHTRALPN